MYLTIIVTNYSDLASFAEGNTSPCRDGGDVVDATLEEPFVLPPVQRRLGNTQGDRCFLGGEVFTAGDGGSHFRPPPKRFH